VTLVWKEIGQLDISYRFGILVRRDKTGPAAVFTSPGVQVKYPLIRVMSKTVVVRNREWYKETVKHKFTCTRVAIFLVFFYIRVTVHRDKFPYNKTNQMH
jgi:hypothetical protein